MVWQFQQNLVGAGGSCLLADVDFGVVVHHANQTHHTKAVLAKIILYQEDIIKYAMHCSLV